MKHICVTGASGHLGSHICPGLVELGYELICVDMVAPREDYGEYRQADLRVENEVRDALKGAELIMHCASIHPWKSYTDEEYLNCNVNGTWNVFRAAQEHGIERVILTSSIAAVGYGPDAKLRPVDESYQQPSLGDMYSLTKRFQEEIAKHFCDYKGMRVIALRPPNFTPKPPVQSEASLLSGCLVVEDMASAHLKAVDVWDKLENSFEPFFITPTFPYSSQEEQQLSSNPKAIVDKYFPGAWDWFEERGTKPSPAPTVYDSGKARQILGWEPEYTFSHWWEKESKK
jgi:nucleoside-diphosphate-sugar epimerase